MYETIIYEKENGIGVIILNKPQRMNALSTQMVEELEKLIDEIERDKEIRVIILAGGDKFFCAGADLKEEKPPDYLKKLRRLFYKIENGEKPVIAAINGIAYGGGLELALVCDLRLASDSARLGMPEIKIGTIPSAGGTQRLPRTIGITKAKEVVLSGNPINGNEAYRIGLVNKVVSVNSLLDEAKKMALVLSERPPLALKMARSAINTGLKIDLESGLDYEARCSAFLSTTKDRKEGRRAFLEKRKPIFKGE